jgi:hypothetical protein
MNERIKELWERACTRYSVYETLKPQDERKIIPDIFAQLIAEDCAKMLDEDSYIMPELGGYAHDIRTRYGVEE